MDNTTLNLEPLHKALATTNLSDLLTGYIARKRVGVRYQEISRAAAQFGLEFAHKDGNVYGAVQLVPVNTDPAPVLRLITHSDHAAVFSGKRRAA